MLGASSEEHLDPQPHFPAVPRRPDAPAGAVAQVVPATLVRNRKAAPQARGKAIGRKGRQPPQAGPRRWIDLFSLLLFTAIVAHVGLAIVVFFQLVKWLVVIGGEEWTGAMARPLAAVLLVPVLVFLLRLGKYLGQALIGLLSARHDKAPDAAAGLPLGRAEYGKLYEIVAEVSQRVGAPLPDEIRVAHRPECFAAELREFGVTPHRRLIVVLGLPLLTVLTVSELKVILAHELAHIGLGHTRFEVFMFRVLGVLRGKLEPAAGRWWRLLDPLHWFWAGSYQLFLWLAAPVMRAQELSADALSAAAYGGELAVRTLLKEWLVVHAFTTTVDSYPSYRIDGEHDSRATIFHHFSQRWQDFSRSAHEYLEARLREEERPSFWDSHPTVDHRIQAMRSFTSAVPEDLRPVSQVLPGFDAIAAELAPAVFEECVSE
jgi:Zn-dependent protease with chaperone function